MCLKDFMKCINPLSTSKIKMALFDVPFQKKNRENGNKKTTNLLAFGRLGKFSQFFQKWSIKKSFFFALNSVFQDALFRLSNGTIP